MRDLTRRLYQLKLLFKDWERNLLLQMHKHQFKVAQIVKNQANKTPPKEMGIYEMPNKEFIVLLKKLSEMQENSNRQLK